MGNHLWDYIPKKNICIILLINLFIIKNLEAKNKNFKEIQILKEDTNKITIKEVLNNNQLFQPYIPTEFNKVKKSYWIKFTYNKLVDQQISYLTFPFILYQNLDLYFVADDSLYHYQTGINVRFKDRNIFSPNLSLPLPNHTGETVCYLHITGFYDNSFFFIKSEGSQMVKSEFYNNSVVYFFTGISCLSVVIGLIFFVFLRNKLYLYYSLFSFSHFYFQFFIDIVFQYFAFFHVLNY